MQRERQRSRNPGIDAEPSDVAPEEDQEELHQQRRTLEDLDEARRKRAAAFLSETRASAMNSAADAAAREGDRRQRIVHCAAVHDEQEFVASRKV